MTKKPGIPGFFVSNARPSAFHHVGVTAIFADTFDSLYPDDDQIVCEKFVKQLDLVFRSLKPIHWVNEVEEAEYSEEDEEDEEGAGCRRRQPAPEPMRSDAGF